AVLHHDQLAVEAPDVGERLGEDRDLLCGGDVCGLLRAFGAGSWVGHGHRLHEWEGRDRLPPALRRILVDGDPAKGAGGGSARHGGSLRSPRGRLLQKCIGRPPRPRMKCRRNSGLPTIAHSTSKKQRQVTEKQELFPPCRFSLMRTRRTAEYTGPTVGRMRLPRVRHPQEASHGAAAGGLAAATDGRVPTKNDVEAGFRWLYPASRHKACVKERRP